MSSLPRESDGQPAGQEPLAVRLVPQDGAGADQVVLSVAGDVDMHTEARLREALTFHGLGPAPARRVVLDLSGVSFLASAGVHVLLEVAGLLEARGGQLLLACVRPMVARVLSLTSADDLIPIVATVGEALGWPGKASSRAETM